MKFRCQIVGPDDLRGPELSVDASSYSSAARVHVICDGPRICLLLQEVLVAVRRRDVSDTTRLYRVTINLTSKAVKP